MQHLNIKKLLAMVMALIMILACFTACGADGSKGNGDDTPGNNSGNNSGSNSGNNNEGSSDPDNNKNPSSNNNSNNNNNSGNNGNSTNNNDPSGQLPSPGNKTEHYFDGLTYYLGNDYNATDNGSYMLHSNGSVAITVTGGATPANITDSKSFAEFFVAAAQAEGYTCTRRFQDDVHYTVTDWKDGSTEIRAFYYYDGYGWCIYATTMNYTSESATLIKYVISGIIDKDYDHSSGNSGNGSINTSPDPGLSDPSLPRPENPDDPFTDTAVINGTKYSFDGLTYTLGKDFNAVNMGDYMMHTNGSATIVVMGGTRQNTSSMELATEYCSQMKENRLVSHVADKNNIFYVITDMRDGTVEIRGFYTDGVHCWNIYATTYNIEKEEVDLVSYITSGIID